MSAEIIELDDYRTKKQKAKLFHSFKTIMGLKDWDISFDELLENGNMGECYADWEAQSADISFQPDLPPEELVKTMIHEMLHCVTAKLRDVEHVRDRVSKKVADAIEQEVWNREEEVVEHLETVIYSLWSANLTLSKASERSE